MPKEISITDLCKIFELDHTILPDMANLGSYEVALRKLRLFKNIFRKQRKKLAMKYHPDKTRGSHDKMAQINSLFDIVMKLAIAKPNSVYADYSWMKPGYTTSTTTSATYMWRYF